MKQTKRIISLILAATMAFGGTAMMSGCDKKGSAKVKDGGKKLTIYCWNEEFKGMMESYYLKDHPLPKGVEIEWVINANDNGVYQQKLDAALEAKEPIDMYLIEADYAKKYVNTDKTVDLKNLGITDAMMSKQYPYTIDVAKSDKGVVKGTSWQAAPGLFMYRRSLAKKYLGTDDPAKVQELVKDWDTFLKTARTVKEKSNGATKFIPSTNDIWQVVRTVRDTPWVKDDKLVIDKQMEWYMDYSKTFASENLTANAIPWSEAWNAGVGNDSIMGYFFSTWGIQFTMTKNCGGTKPGQGTYGDWAAVNGPQQYYWGGTWLTAAPTCDNKTLVADIMNYFTINTDSMKKYCLGSKDYVNNTDAIKQIIDSGFTFDFLGGQNHYALFQAQAGKINTKAMSGYDQNINIALDEQVQAYATGKKDKATAVSDFKKTVADKFPEITVEK